MYIAPHVLNVKIKNDSNGIVRGVELAYLNDIGRKARISKVKSGDYTNIIIVTKGIEEKNKLILKLRSGKTFEINEEVIENPIDYVLQIDIKKFDEESMEFETKYIKYEDAIA